MVVTALIFTKFILIRQIFIQNSYIVFHENPTKTLEADTRSQTDVWADSRTDRHSLTVRLSLF